jgi:hypothetical protein
MNNRDIEALMKGIAPVVRDLVRDEVKAQVAAASERMAAIVESKIIQGVIVRRSAEVTDDVAQRAIEG